MSACSTCRAPIVWAYTEKGKRIPLDAQPADDGLLRAIHSPVGNLVAAGGEIAGVMVVKVQSPGYFVSHFATCPEADRHRRAR